MEPSTLPASAQTFVTPAWVQDAVFYQIFPDRFAQSERVAKPSNLEPWDSPPTIHGFKGGDLLGVAEHLDYLSDLGINAIYFCPVFRSTANHRYHTHDYFQIDPILGGNEAFRTLLDEAHRRNMRVVIDGVFNHASRGFFQFSHILENGAQSPYLDWFHVRQWPLSPYGSPDQPPGYDCWWGNRELPEFNTDTGAVREYLWSVGEYWIEQGIDGWRLDVPNEIDDDEFWREFRRRVKSVNSDAYIVGEIWGDARRWLSGDQFDAVMNYLFTKACIGFFTGPRGIDQEIVRGTGLDPVQSIDAAAFRDTINWILSLYPWTATLAQLNLLDSHDTARFLSIARGDVSAYKLAVLCAMAFPGAPCVYYGDEIGMTGGATVEEARGGFIWDRSKWNQDLHDYVKSAIGLRHAQPVLRGGDFKSLYAENGVYAFSRTKGNDIAVVGLNAGSQDSTVNITLTDGCELRGCEAVWGKGPESVSGNLLKAWTIPARSGAVVVGHTGR